MLTDGIIKNINEKGITYYPDVWAKFKDGKQFLFDVKHSSFFEELTDNIEKFNNWNSRVKCILEFCEKNGLNYEVVVTDFDIMGERLNNNN